MQIHTCRRFRLEPANKWTEIDTLNNIAYRYITGPIASEDPLSTFLQSGSQIYDGEKTYWLISSRTLHDTGSPYTAIIGWTKADGNPFDGAGEWVIEKWLIRSDATRGTKEGGRQWPNPSEQQ